MPNDSTGARLAVDIGGTFTDVVLESVNNRTTSKVLTTPSAPEEGMIAGVTDVLARSGVAAETVELLIHGTTLATNAVIERKGAVTALVTTDGFRDVLEIGYESRYDQYDVMLQKAVPLVPRMRRFTVAERVDRKGNVVRELDEDAVRRLIPRLRDCGAESIVIGFLHAYANPTHEQRTGEILAEAFPEVSITLSSDVCPEVREYERLTTATANAYVRPLMASYLSRLAHRLAELELSCPVLLMTSGGGLTTLDTAKRHPIRLAESGPAGGAILAREIAMELGLDKVISFDMGGTTAKICLIEDFEPGKAREFEVDRQARFLKGSGLPLRIPVIEMVEIGAGGGSIARVDSMRRITVGPDSAGADPGPAAYDRGGVHPTITDADIVLGKIDPDRFAGGNLTLQTDLARRALETDIGEPLGLTAEMAAFGITEIVDETMSNAARVHAVEQGEDAAEHTLIAFGGAAPLHVGHLAEKLGVSRIVIPTNAGVGSAIGFLRAPVSYEVVRSMHMSLAAFHPEPINRVMSEMSQEALGIVEAGAPGADVVEQRQAYMRYRGQGHEIVVTLPNRPLDASDKATLQAAFDEEYVALYMRVLPNAEVEVLTWALTISTVPRPAEKPSDAGTSGIRDPASARNVYDAETDRTVSVPLYWRPDLVPGVKLSGPALIAEDETTSFVPAGFDACVSGSGHIVMQRIPENDA